MAGEITDTLIGHQREAEWLFAAAVFFNPATAIQDCGWLDPALIQDAQVRQYWTDIQAGKSPDKAAIDNGMFYKLTGYLTGETFSPSYLSSFAATVSEDVYLVKVACAIGEMARALSERDIDKVQTMIGDLATSKPTESGAVFDAADAGLEFLASIDDEDTTIKTGISTVDMAIGGWERKTLTMLAARPSMGKTSLGWQFATGAVDRGLRALYFSPEMSRRILFARAACGAAKIDYRDYKGRRLTEAQKNHVIEISNDLMNRYGRNLFIDDRSRITTRDIWQAVSKLRPDVFFVDHLGLVTEDETDSRVEALHRIAWGGKQIAKEFDCAAFYLYQLSRGTELRDDKRPELKDLRGSGRLEEDGDMILFLYRPDYYDKNAGPVKVSETDLIVGKDREGARNVCIHLMYNLEEQKFYPKARDLATATPAGRR